MEEWMGPSIGYFVGYLNCNLILYKKKRHFIYTDTYVTIYVCMYKITCLCKKTGKIHLKPRKYIQKY
jgi:hypothetical protein